MAQPSTLPAADGSGYRLRVQARHTRSGREYGQVRVEPIPCPPDFLLSRALESAIALDTDSAHFDVDDFHRQGSRAGSLEDGADINNAPTAEDLQTHAAMPQKRGRLLEEGELEEGPGDAKKARKIRYHKTQRAKRFALQRHLPSTDTARKHVGTAANITVDVDLNALPFTRCGYHAVNLPKNASTTPSQVMALDELLLQGYQLVKHTPGTSQPLVDAQTKRVFAVVVGVMDDPTYADSAKKAAAAFDEARHTMEFDSRETEHRRGSFAAVNYGISYGQGSRFPHWLKCRHEDVLKGLLANEHVIRLASFASFAFAMWAPKVYNYYDSTIRQLGLSYPHLTWAHWNSIWLCTTFNFGPNVCCTPHRDSLNLPFGWCAITALGNFDHTLGGHLVLHDLRLVIEFPPGSLILIPSALLNHSNTPTRSGECRMSFTQFCSGGIFRFVDNGFKCEADLKQQDPERHAEVMAAKLSRKDFGIGLWSTQEELLDAAGHHD